MSVTIDDISKHLGLSVSTVSKALNGYSDVSPITRERVMEATKALGYHPNGAARNLRRGRTDRIGLLINNPIEFLNEYLGDVMSGAAVAAERFEQNLVMYTKQVIDPSELQRICRAREVDGLLLIFEPSKAAVQVLAQERTPYVVFGRRTAYPDVSYIAPDNYRGAYQLTQHLILQGHRRIAFTTRPALGMTNRDRFAGYQQALHDVGIAFDADLVVETHSGQHDGNHALLQLLELPVRPTALFAFYDLVAADAIEAANANGLIVPDDIAIVGFDGLRMSTRTQPPLTTVRQPLSRMGQRAVEMLVSHIENGKFPTKQVTMPVELIVRQSG